MSTRARLPIIAAYVIATTLVLLPVYVVSYPIHLRSLYGPDPDESERHFSGGCRYVDFKDPALIFRPLEALLNRSKAADSGMRRLSTILNAEQAYYDGMIWRLVRAIPDRGR